MPSTPLYLVALARLASGRNDPEYHSLPPHLRGLADAASAARDAYLALADASRQAHTAGAEWAAESIGALELAQWNVWQHMERDGAELLAAHAAAVTTPAYDIPAMLDTFAAAWDATPVGGSVGVCLRCGYVMADGQDHCPTCDAPQIGGAA